MNAWTPMNGRRPPKTANGHSSMVYDETREQLLLVTPGEGIEVWGWDGAGWETITDGLVPNAPSSRPLAAFGLCDTYIFVPGDGHMRVVRLGAPYHVQLIDVTELARWGYSHGTAGFDAESTCFWVHVTDYEGGTTFSFDGERLEKLVDGPALMSGCWDAANGRLVGIDIEDTLYAFDGEAWTVLHAEHMPTSSDIGYDTSRDRLFRLVAHSDEGMRLHELAGGGWQPTDREMRPLMASAVVGFDKGRGELVSYGGQDFRKGADWSDETWVSDGGDLVNTASEADRLELGRHTTPVQLDGKLVAINHSTLAADALGVGGWEVLVDPVDSHDADLGPLRHSRLYDLSVNFAAGDDTLYMLDGDGGLWTSSAGSKWRQLCGPGRGPNGHYARRVAMAFDAARERLVLFGGVESNTTWVFGQKGWQEFDDEIRPIHGVASAVSTPEGVYLLAGPDLWLLEETCWRCVASDPDWRGAHLCYDSKRNALLSFGEDGDGWRLGVWVDDAWRNVAALPDDVRLATPYSGDAEVGVDPQGDRVVILDKSMFWALDLSACELSDATLPTGECEPARATTPAPEGDMVDAVALVTTDGEPRHARELGLQLVIPKEWRLVATIPNHPVVTAMEGFGGLAVLMHPQWWNQDFEPWRLGGGGIEVVLLAEEPPLLVADPYDDNMMVPADTVAFRELSPALQSQYNTLPDAQLDRAYGTKLGGFPRYVQDDVLEYYEGDDHPQFVLQLRADVFDCMFGDFGAAYVFINEYGVGKAVMQSH
ncbi:DUF1963 domain-containing protein [Persicimonas caeni]|nr:DUF1963 domain-containing protein [Persicimonas caeni]